MNVRIADLMTRGALVARPHDTVDQVRALMTDNGVHCIPVEGPDGAPVGIVTSSDLSDPEVKGASPVSQHMSSPVLRVPAYNDVSQAARAMINHHCHHVVITHEGRIEGVISSFDLLQLVAEHRFVVKNPPQSATK
jgi:CBS domain-containing protein